MPKFDHKAAFYRMEFDSSQFIQELDKLTSTEDVQAFFMPIHTQTPVLEIFKKAMKSFGLELLKSKKALHQYRLSYSFKEGGRDRQESGKFFIMETDEDAGISVIVSIEGSHFISHGLQMMVRKMSKVMTSFVSHKRLQSLVADFQRVEQFKAFSITKTSLGFRYGAKKQMMSSVFWTDHSLEEMFSWVAENNGWFKSIRFDAKKQLSPTATVTLNRQGTVKASFFIEKVFKSFVVPFSSDLSQNVQQFKDRGRRENETLSARPLTIRFDENKFEEKKENLKFIESMRTMDKVSVSVVHGNPYIYMTLLDYADGSSFELWVLNDQELVIVPQMKCTIASLERLVNHVFDTYSEGDVLEYAGA